MQIAMFGATRGTGSLILAKALADGHNVRLLARNPDSLAAELRNNPSVKLVRGDARDAAAVNETLTGAQAVFSTLGAKSPFAKSDLLGRAMPLILAAMQRHAVERLLVLGSGGWQPGALALQSPFRRWVMQNIGMRLLKEAIRPQQQQESVILPSDRAWTIAAPTRLTNSKPCGKYRSSTEALPPNALQIARGDVANFLYKQLGSAGFVRQRVYLTW